MKMVSINVDGELLTMLIILRISFEPIKAIIQFPQLQLPRGTTERFAPVGLLGQALCVMKKQLIL